MVRRRMPRPRTILAIALLAVALAGCGREGSPGRDRTGAGTPAIGVQGDEAQAATEYPAFATKNTTRVGGADPIADAAAIARATFPSSARGGPPANRARAVTLAPARDWRAALAASVLMATPTRAPVLLADGDEIPAASSAALEALAPTGSPPAGDAQVIRVGDVPRPEGLRTTDIRGRDPAALARAVDAFSAAARGRASRDVLIVPSDEPRFAMPAAGLAAKSGVPILFTGRDAVPRETIAAIRARRRPRMYVLGPSQVISPQVTRRLGRLGRVVRIGGPDPISNAVEFATFSEDGFGWGVSDPGHGLVFLRVERTADAAAAAPLSAAGKYGPVLLLDSADRLPRVVEEYLLDIQPGYTKDPVRAFYNHGWLVGDREAISEPLQARIDEILEIRPVEDQRTETP